jgi:hypothetical protein
MGLRKFYKQKNLVENKWYRFIFYVNIKIYLYMLVDLILLCNIKITYYNLINFLYYLI